MIIEVLNIRRIIKTFRVLALMVTKSLFAITILKYYSVRHDRGFGLFFLEAGMLPEYRNRLGIQVDILWWSWSWIRNEK